MDQKRTRIDELTGTLNEIKTTAKKLEIESVVTEEIIRELEFLKKTRIRNCELRKALDKARSGKWKWWTCC